MPRIVISESFGHWTAWFESSPHEAYGGVLGCNAAGRIAVGMSGGFDVAFPPEGQGPRMPSLAVLTQSGALEWSHFHGSIDDAAVAPDGWVATCGALHTLDLREWEFLNSLVGARNTPVRGIVAALVCRETGAAFLLSQPSGSSGA